MVTGLSSLQNLTVLAGTAVLLAATGCDRPDTGAHEAMERQACLSSELAPIEALAACSRYIAVNNDRTLSRSDAYYNRGVAFAGLGEFHHARLDLEASLKLDPANRWARQRLENVNQALSRTGG